MSLLSRKELRERILGKPPLIENMIDIETQLQPNSVEMTLQRVEVLEGTGAIDFDNNERKLPSSRPLEFDGNDWIFLHPGTYKVIFNEIVNIPKDLAAIARPRSSMLRCGVNIGTAVWDAGYRGRSESMLVVYNPGGFKLRKNARIIQLLFYKLHTEVEEGYNGQYQYENI
ncbi:MAG: deoxyuridine 5'-triphosphate nucleotidohydrolase [Methanomethylovorans sp.]|jgi:dUTP pyrophosphatase|nr:deoxyuridine 5'-triphosphate nucleotidohydrolase [Methanomethylovorans sp.]